MNRKGAPRPHAGEDREGWGELFELAPVGYLTVDAKGIIRLANRQATVLLGESADGLRGTRLTRFLSRADARKLSATLTRASSGEHSSCEVELTSALPDARWLQLDAARTPKALRLVTIRDITAQHESVAGLRETKDRYAGLFTEMGNGFTVNELVVDSGGSPVDYVTREVNRRYEEILGVKRAQVVGRRTSEFLPAEELRSWLDIFGPVALGGSEARYETYSPTNDKYFRGYVYSPKRGWFAVVFEDVTAQRRTGEQLARSQAELKAIYDNAPILMCTLDEGRRVLHANRAFTEFTSIPEADLLEGRACGAFGCINAGDDPRGCGFGPKCVGCGLRLAIDDTLAKGSGHRDVEYRATLDTGGTLRKAVLLGSTSRIVAADRRMTLLCLQDITTRDRTEQTLHESEQRFQMAIEATSDGIWEWTDLAVPRFWWSPRFCALLGYGPDELDPSLDTFMDLMHPGDRERIRDEMAIRLASAEPFESSYRLRTKPGEYRWFMARGVVRADQRGKPGRMIGSIRDITDRKRAEEQLRQSEQIYKTLIENTPDIIARFDKALRHVFVSPSITRVTGKPASAFIGRTNGELGMPADRVALWDLKLLAAFQTGQVQGIDFEFQGSGGSRQFTSVLVPERSEDGEVVSVLSVARDMTEVRSAQKTLAAEESRHGVLLETIQEGILTLDGLGTVVFANQAMARMLGHAPATLRGKPLSAFVAEDAGETAEVLLAGWMAGSSERRETALFRADQSRIEVEISAGWFESADGIPAGVIASVLDITERKAAERDLHQSHGKLRSLARHLLRAREEERRKVAQEIHDELGQVLTGLSMDLRWLARRLEGAPEQVREKVRGVIDLADHTIRMVQRISSELRPRMLDDLGLGPALEWLAGDFSRRMGVACGAEVTVNESRIGGNTATVLYRIVQEAFTNVARHARATKVSVRLRENRECLELRIVDNGIGITEKDAADPRSFGLIGLRERVQEMDGEVSIQGQPGRGTTITISIPFPQGGNLA